MLFFCNNFTSYPESSALSIPWNTNIMADSNNTNKFYKISTLICCDFFYVICCYCNQLTVVCHVWKNVTECFCKIFHSVFRILQFLLEIEIHKSNVESSKLGQSDPSLLSLGSSGIQILAIIVLFGPRRAFFSSFHDKEWPSRGGKPYRSLSSVKPREEKNHTKNCNVYYQPKNNNTIITN